MTRSMYKYSKKWINFVLDCLIKNPHLIFNTKLMTEIFDMVEIWVDKK
jgi:hypothetical protein